MRRLNDPGSAMYGLVSTGLVAGLALIEPRNLTTGRRVAYRVGVAAVTAWAVLVSMRPSKDSDPDLLRPIARSAVTVGAGGAAFGLAEAGEAVDARIHDGLLRAGVRKPRLWIAAGEAALSVAAWWAGRLGDRADADDLDDYEEPERTLVGIPAGLRTVASRLLSATDEYGAPELREQLAGARLISFDDGAIEASFAQFDIREDLPRAVPGNGRFPVIGRFQAQNDRTFDIRVFVEDGRLESIHIDEGADWSEEELEAWHETGRDLSELTVWPSPDEVRLFTESGTGYMPVNT